MGLKQSWKHILLQPPELNAGLVNAMLNPTRHQWTWLFRNLCLRSVVVLDSPRVDAACPSGRTVADVAGVRKSEELPLGCKAQRIRIPGAPSCRQPTVDGLQPPAAIAAATAGATNRAWTARQGRPVAAGMAAARPSLLPPFHPPKPYGRPSPPPRCCRADTVGSAAVRRRHSRRCRSVRRRRCWRRRCRRPFGALASSVGRGAGTVDEG